MACSCKTDIEGKLLDRFKGQSPEATEHRVELKGYALIFGKKLEQKGCMTLEAVADFPLKKGGVKSKKQTQNMIFNFCPFCGVNYGAEPVAAPTTADVVPA